MGSEPGRERESDIHRAGRRFLTYALLPAWTVTGFADYVCHRRSDIEHTSGTHESLTHLLMLGSAGVGLAAALYCEVNETVLAIMTASALMHEAIVWWDVGYAAKLRPPSATEQHLHSFLEVLPFTGLAFTACLNPDDVAVLLGRGSRPPTWQLRWKRDPAAPLMSTAVMGAAALFLVAPHLEEFARCYRIDHTLLPRKPQRRRDSTFKPEDEVR